MAGETYVTREGSSPTFATVTATTLIGNLTGNVTGNVTGDLTGDVTGDVTGNVTGGVQNPVAVISADGALAIPSTSTCYFITENSDGAAITLVDPTATTHDGLVLTFISTTAQAHTLDLVTGINGGAADIGTWGGAAGDGVQIIAYQGVWYEVPSVNTNVTWA